MLLSEIRESLSDSENKQFALPLIVKDSRSYSFICYHRLLYYSEDIVNWMENVGDGDNKWFTVTYTTKKHFITNKANMECTSLITFSLYELVNDGQEERVETFDVTLDDYTQMTVFHDVATLPPVRNFYNRVIRLIEDHTQMSIEEFTNGTFDYLDNK